VHGSAKDLK